MGFIKSFKNAFSMSEEEYLEDMDMEEEEDYTPPRAAARSRSYDQIASDNVVDIRSSSAPSSAGASTSRTHVVFKKVDSFEEVVPVADILNEKRIVVLNLETCPNEDSRRVIDFLSGVAYANDGTMQRVAGRAYIIIPSNTPLSGELLDEAASSAAQGSFF